MSFLRQKLAAILTASLILFATLHCACAAALSAVDPTQHHSHSCCARADTPACAELPSPPHRSHPPSPRNPPCPHCSGSLCLDKSPTPNATPNLARALPFAAATLHFLMAQPQIATACGHPTRSGPSTPGNAATLLRLHCALTV